MHQFSVALHEHLTKSTEDAERELQCARENGNAARVSYLEGRLEALAHLRALTAKYDLKFHRYY